MERIRGESETRSTDGTIESHLHMRVTGNDPAAGVEGGGAEAAGGGLQNRLSDLGDRASGFADQLRGSFGDRLGRTAQRLEDRTGALSTIRSHPIPAVGLAFSVGFLVAAFTVSDDRNWVLERARRRLRRLIISSVTAALAHELRHVIGADEGLGDLVESLLDTEDEDEYEDYYAV